MRLTFNNLTLLEELIVGCVIIQEETQRNIPVMDKLTLTELTTLLELDSTGLIAMIFSISKDLTGFNWNIALLLTYEHKRTQSKCMLFISKIQTDGYGTRYLYLIYMKV